MKYARLYGFQHKRTEGQFEITWKELQQGLPKDNDGTFLLGVSENRLLLDGVPLDPGQAERSFAQFLTAAGLASISFSNKVTIRRIRQTGPFLFGFRFQSAGRGHPDQRHVRRLQEFKYPAERSVKFIAFPDPSTGDVSIAAQIVAQTLGPEFKDWLNDPQKLLQLIAAAEGSRNGGPSTGTPGQGDGIHRPWFWNGCSRGNETCGPIGRTGKS